MMASRHGDAFCVTVPLSGESTVTKGVPQYFLCCLTVLAGEQTTELPVTGDNIMLMWHHQGGDRWWESGPWFNIKMSSYRYRKSHCGDKTMLRPSYLHNGISYPGKITYLYWIGALPVKHINPLSVEFETRARSSLCLQMSQLHQAFSRHYDDCKVRQACYHSFFSDYWFWKCFLQSNDIK